MRRKHRRPDHRTHLSNSTECDLFVGDQHPHWIPHESLSNFEDFGWHGGRHNHDLAIGWHLLKKHLHVFIESFREHYIAFVQHDNPKSTGVEHPLVHYVVKHSSRCAGDHVRSSPKRVGVTPSRAAPDRAVDSCAKVIAKRCDDLQKKGTSVLVFVFARRKQLLLSLPGESGPRGLALVKG